MTRRDGYVYLAQCSTGHFKIGISKNPEKRIKHFDTIMPVRVAIVYKFICDDAKSAEQKLHAKFDDFRVSGEWFDFSFDRAESEILSIFCYLDGEFRYDQEISDAQELIAWSKFFQETGYLLYAELPY